MPPKRASLADMSAEEQRIAKMVAAGADSAPPILGKYLKIAAPAIGWIFVLCEAALPYIIKLISFGMSCGQASPSMLREGG